LRAILPGVQLFVMYGQTEATARISIMEPGDLDLHLGTVGKPLNNLKIKIVGESGRSCDPGEAGEIWVSGPSVTKGYWCDPEATQRKFAEGWLKTGDLGTLDDEGFLTVTGRRESFVKIRGLRVDLGEVESIALKNPEVREAAACAIPDPRLGESIALLLVLARDCSQSTTLAQIRRTLPPQWFVEQIRFVDQLPKANNKVDRSRLQDIALREAA
jgi:acyl-CoA synthetase (AMP-forming)/AMP-acid ligase II